MIKLPIGTRSLLFGAHCFWLHPWFVLAAWVKLYGWRSVSWPLLLACVVHDWGYWKLPNMDGPEGELHPYRGASIVSKQVYVFGGSFEDAQRWFYFTLYHSRFLAKRNNKSFSRLCVADKFSSALTPAWLYVPMCMATGEIWEYMDSCECPHHDPWKWYAELRSFMTSWVEQHRDEQPESPKSRSFYPNRSV